MRDAKRTGAPSEPIRIAIDGRYLARPGVGIHEYVCRLLDLMLEAGHSVTVLTNTDAGVPLSSTVEVARFGSSRNLVWDQIDLARHLRRNAYDVYWAPASAGVPVFAPIRLPIVFTIHDLVPLMMPRRYIIGRPTLGLPWLAGMVAGALRARVVVTVSDFSASRIRGFLRRRSHVIPPAQVRQLSEDSNIPPRHQDLRGPYVLFHGGADPRKRVDSLIEAFSSVVQSQDLQLVLLGNHMETWDPLIDLHGMVGRVIRPGYVSATDRDRWIRHAWAVAYPSELEGFGLPLLEAMQFGVPVVTAPNSSLLEVGGSAALYASPADPSQLAAALISLADPVVRDRCVRRGLGRAQHYASLDRAGLVAAVLQTAISGRRPMQRRWRSR